VKSRVLAIAVAAVLALIGVIAILAYVRQANERAIAGLKAETVEVAAGPIPAGMSLSQASQQNLLRTEDLPESSLANAGRVVHGLTAQNRPMVVNSTMAGGQVLLQKMLAPAGTVPASPGSLPLPPKMGAISIDICVPEDVASYVTPESDVAVFDILVSDSVASTTLTPSCGPSHPVLGRDLITSLSAISSMLVLPRVKVLAVVQNSGSQTGSGNGAATAAQPATSPSSSTDMLVTFAVDQQEAEQLMVLQQGGIPYLVLLGADASMNPGLGPGGL
jgi:pilus assembly protein CpaB